jgi:hypothetical protein
MAVGVALTLQRDVHPQRQDDDGDKRSESQT